MVGWFGASSRSLALLSWFIPLAAFGATPPIVWTAPATVKIRPADPLPPTLPTSVELSAARNEFEAFQVVVSGLARDVRVTASSLQNPQFTICGDGVAPGCGTRNVYVYAEPLITLRRASSSDPESSTGAWPDALVPAIDEVVGEPRNAFPFSSRAGESHAVWIEIHVPRDATPGEYRGTVTVSASGATLAVVPVTLTVWSFTLPSTSSARSAFALAYGALPSGFGFSASDQATFTSLRYAFGWFALDHRVTLSHLDDGVAYGDLPYLAAHYAPLLDGTVAPARLTGARMTSFEYLGNGSVADLSRWSSFFAAHPGWSDGLFQYTCDEPPSSRCGWSDILSRARNAHDAQPTPLRTLVTTTIQQADASEVSFVIDLLVPLVNYMDDKPGQPYPGDQRPRYDAFLSGPGKELWMYQSCMSHDCGGAAGWATGWPSYMIDASAVRNRAMQWLLYRFGATGELYYETGYALAAKRDAWTDQWAYTGNGDGTLFYPGTVAKIGGRTPIPIASIRLKMIREGMEDFEYLKILERCGHADQARSIARGLFPDAWSAGAVTPEQLMSTRRQLAELIVANGCPTP